MSNIGLTLSFVIGGLLLISLLTLNDRVAQNSGETVMDMQAKKTVESVSSIMRRDFARMGYNTDHSTDVIESFGSKKIIFWADIDTNSVKNPQKITWEFTDNSVQTTPNPNDFKLIRTSPATSDSSVFSVTEFQFTYSDKDGNTVTPGDPASKIRSINVNLQTQSHAKYENGQYSVSFWEKKFTPPNLSLQDMEW